MIKRLFTPGMYHGQDNQKVFFEGWYYKMISADQNQRWVVIPGIFHHPDPARAHSFIQVLNGITNTVEYHRFPFKAFQASSTNFNIQIDSNSFHSQGFTLNLLGVNQQIQGDLVFGDLKPWPISLISPGVMGPYRFAPFLQTYHGVLSLDHEIMGNLKINGVDLDFVGGRGYMEKDWGKTFPRAYIWMQSNHFPENDVSLTASVATIPWLRGWFRGFLVGFLFDGTLYRFTTYLGSKIIHLSVNDHFVIWTLQGSSRSNPSAVFSGYRLEIKAHKGQGGLLSSPEVDGMTPRILESLTSDIEVILAGLNKQGNNMEIIYQGKGSSAGLEIAGSVNEIADVNKLEEV